MIKVAVGGKRWLLEKVVSGEAEHKLNLVCK